MQRFDTFVGALRYEFRMQIRRRSVWITFIALGLFFIVFHQPWYRSITTPAGDALVYWTGEVQSFLAIAVGILLADRLPRDRRTKVEEVLDTLPGAPGARVFGKYLGSTLATLVPMFAVYCVGVGYIISRWHDVQALPIALATFAAIVLPGILFNRSIFHCLPCHSLGAALPVSLRGLLVLGQLASQFRHPDPERDDPYSRRRIHVYRVLQSGGTRGRVFSGNPGRNGPPGR